MRRWCGDALRFRLFDRSRYFAAGDIVDDLERLRSLRLFDRDRRREPFVARRRSIDRLTDRSFFRARLGLTDRFTFGDAAARRFSAILLCDRLRRRAESSPRSFEGRFRRSIDGSRFLSFFKSGERSDRRCLSATTPPPPTIFETER